MNSESENFLASGEGMIKFFRRMFEAGVSFGALMKVVNHDDQLARAAAYIKAGCPEIEFVDGKQVVTSASAETDQFLTVNPELTFDDRINRCQCGADRDLTEKNFPVTTDQVGEWEWKLFHFNRNISSEEAIRLMKEDGFEPGAIGHILTFGEINPKEQRKYPIIGLGSVAEVCLHPNVPLLCFDRGRRKIDLTWFDSEWSYRCRFLGVRRRSVT